MKIEEITCEQLMYDIVAYNSDRETIEFEDTNNRGRVYLMTEVSQRLGNGFFDTNKIWQLFRLQDYLNMNQSEYFLIK